MTRLYTEDGTYTDEANALHASLFRQIRELTETLENPREIQILLADIAGISVSTTILTRMAKRRREDQKAPQQQRLPFNQAGQD